MDKQSFLIYKSFYEPVKHLSDDELGKLFRAIFQYQITGQIPELESSINMAFMFYKNQFDLDNDKYEKRVETLRANGSKGGRPKKTKDNQKKQKVFSEPKKAVNVNVNDNVNVKYKLLTKDGTYIVTEQHFEELQHTYQFVNCAEEFNKMNMWLKSNVSKLKTNRGMPRFINSWMSRQADQTKTEKSQMSYAEIGKIVRNEQINQKKVLTLDEIKELRQNELNQRRIQDVHTKH